MILVAAILLLVLYIFLAVKRPGLALATCPIPLIATTFYVGGVAQIDAFVIAIAAAIIFVTVLTIVLRAKSSDVDDRWPQIWAKAIAWILGSIALLVVLVGIFKPLGLIFWAVFIGSVVHYKTTRGRAITMYVISTIGAGMRQNLPLTAALEAAAANQKDVHAVTLRRISKWLVQGYSLAEALKRGYPKCPADVVATIAAAEKINQLPQAIKSIEQNLLERLDASRRVEPVSPAYPAVVLLVAFSIMLFLMMKIVPVFSIVLEDLSEGKMGLPKSTAILFALTNSLFENQWLLAVLLLVFPVIIYMIIYARLRVRRPEKVYLISWITDFIKWHMPVMHWFEFNYSMLRLVSILRVSLNAGCTVNDAIRNSLGLNVNNRFRKRMLRWLERIERGEDISAAAQKSGMGNALVWAFDTEVNQGNTPEILEMLEEFYRSNYSYRINLARFILEPCMVLMLGSVVGFIVYAMFSPMVAMIHCTADMVLP